MSSDSNKSLVTRFNIEVIQNDDEQAFHQLMSVDFVNHSAPPGAPRGREGMWNTFHNILHPALSDLSVVIHEQVAEGDMVTTRKTITGKHTGPLLGIAPTGKQIAIDVIDMVRLRDDLYVEHWGVNTLPSVIAELKTK